MSMMFYVIIFNFGGGCILSDHGPSGEGGRGAWTQQGRLEGHSVTASWQVTPPDRADYYGAHSGDMGSSEVNVQGQVG
jgi:hypothetical protein